MTEMTEKNSHEESNKIIKIIKEMREEVDRRENMVFKFIQDLLTAIERTEKGKQVVETE